MGRLLQPFPPVEADGLKRYMHWECGFSDLGGQRGVRDMCLHLAVAGARGAVSVAFRTNWHLPATYEGWKARGVGPWRFDGIDLGMDLGLIVYEMLSHFFFEHRDDEEGHGSKCLYNPDPEGWCGWEDVHDCMVQDQRHQEFATLFISEGPEAAYQALAKLYHDRIDKRWIELQQYDGCHT